MTRNQLVRIRRPNGNIVTARFICQDERGIWVRLNDFFNTEVCVQEVQS